MKIREADNSDRNNWDSFVDSEGGNFCLYYDWKQFYEARGDRFIPLMIETDSSQLMGIFPMAKEKTLLYSFLESEGGFLFKKDLSEFEKHEAMCALVKHVDSNYSKGCSGLFVKEWKAHFDNRCNIPVAACFDSGFKYHYCEATGFPCTHIMELKTPFEERHWNVWPRQIKQQIKKAISNGVVIIHDQELSYINQFIVMLGKNFKRHKNNRSIVHDTKVRARVFKEKSKLYIALQNGQPVLGLLCHYTPLTCFCALLGSYERDSGGASKLCFKIAIEEACNDGYKYVNFGMSDDENTALYKERFKQPIKLPMGTYGKKYSPFRYRLYQACELFDELRKDKMYLWHNRNKLWEKISE
jgi:hypothetical protein